MGFGSGVGTKTVGTIYKKSVTSAPPARTAPVRPTSMLFKKIFID